MQQWPFPSEWVTADRMESAEQYRNSPRGAKRWPGKAWLRPELAAALLETAYLWREVRRPHNRSKMPSRLQSSAHLLPI